MHDGCSRFFSFSSFLCVQQRRRHCLLSFFNFCSVAQSVLVKLNKWRIMAVKKLEKDHFHKDERKCEDAYDFPAWPDISALVLSSGCLPSSGSALLCVFSLNLIAVAPPHFWRRLIGCPRAFVLLSLSHTWNWLQQFSSVQQCSHWRVKSIVVGCILSNVQQPPYTLANQVWESVRRDWKHRTAVHLFLSVL